MINRGEPVLTEKTAELKNERLNELAQPETISTDKIIYVYLATFLFFLVGIIVGWNWANARKTLPNGVRVRTYSQKVRDHGIRIFSIGIGLLILFAYKIILQPSLHHL